MRFSTSIAIAGLAASAFAAPVAEPGFLGAVTTVASAAVATVTETVAAVLAILEGTCTAEWQCTITINGPLVNMIADAADVPITAQASISAWCYEGHCYAASQTNLGVPVPFAIACTTPNVCTGTLSGAVNQTFANGKELELWGWATPSGYCTSGECYASLTTLGDPCYK